MIKKSLFLFLVMSVIFGDADAMTRGGLEHASVANITKQKQDLINELDSRQDLMYLMKKNGFGASYIKGMINEPYRDDRMPLMHRLVQDNYPDLVEQFLKSGGDPNIVNNNPNDDSDDTPLTLSVCFLNQPIAKILLENGANVNATDGVVMGRRTPLYICFDLVPSGNNILMANFLLNHNANPNQGDIYGLSPLSKLCTNFSTMYPTLKENDYTPKQRTKLAKLLITFGANNNGKDINHQRATAVEVAKVNGYVKLAQKIENLFVKRDNVFKKVENGEAIEYTKNGFPVCFVKDSEGNTLVHRAIKYNNLSVLKNILSIRPELLIKPNFANKRPIDEPLSGDVAGLLLQGMVFDEK